METQVLKFKSLTDGQIMKCGEKTFELINCFVIMRSMLKFSTFKLSIYNNNILIFKDLYCYDIILLKKIKNTISQNKKK
ncbi:hypothetical protein BpHYR1_052496 [Brachionus plicatilis]|uniref:Uncharacterized protein n=1 Tax=Brachionus plicatilis TaxID=10195 RepID=A0A3M7R954_BRAPC|nr:hypothetical protein BpHYR1_052496 [Brachionus plicatilis]